MNDNERIEELEPTEETQFPEENLENGIDDEEMTSEEVQDEIQDDEEEKVKDDIEQPFYAVTPEYDELRPVLSELDYRLFLINNDLVLIVCGKYDIVKTLTIPTINEIVYKISNINENHSFKRPI